MRPKMRRQLQPRSRKLLGLKKIICSVRWLRWPKSPKPCLKTVQFKLQKPRWRPQMINNEYFEMINTPILIIIYAKNVII